MYETLHFDGDQVGWMFSTTAVAAMISPLFVGYVADRFFATEKLLAGLHLIGAVLLAIAAFMHDFTKLFTVMQAYAICYMPTLALTNSISFANIADFEKGLSRHPRLGNVGLDRRRLGDRIFGRRQIEWPVFSCSRLVGHFGRLLPLPAAHATEGKNRLRHAHGESRTGNVPAFGRSHVSGLCRLFVPDLHSACPFITARRTGSWNNSKHLTRLPCKQSANFLKSALWPRCRSLSPDSA